MRLKINYLSIAFLLILFMPFIYSLEVGTRGSISIDLNRVQSSTPVNVSNETANNSLYLVGIPGSDYALDSDLDSYVPYTGATGDLDMGNHNIEAQNVSAFYWIPNNIDGIMAMNAQSGLTDGARFQSSEKNQLNLYAGVATGSSWNTGQLLLRNGSASLQTIVGGFSPSVGRLEVFQTNITNYDDTYFLEDAIITGEIIAPNICYSNGTNCPPSGAGNPFDQVLNTTSDVNFTNITSRVGLQIGEGGVVSGGTWLNVNDNYDHNGGIVFRTLLGWTGTTLADNAGGLVYQALNHAPTVNISSTITTAGATFNSNPTYQLMSTFGLGKQDIYLDGANVISYEGASTVSEYNSFTASPSFTGSGAGSVTVNNYDVLDHAQFDSGTSSTMTVYNGLNFAPLKLGGTYTLMRGVYLAPSVFSGTITEFRGIEIPNVAGSRVTGISSTLASSGLTKMFINHTGTAPSTHAGRLTIGQTNANTTSVLHVANNTDSGNSSSIHAVGNIVTEGNFYTMTARDLEYRSRSENEGFTYRSTLPDNPRDIIGEDGKLNNYANTIRIPETYCVETASREVAFNEFVDVNKIFNQTELVLMDERTVEIRLRDKFENDPNIQYSFFNNTHGVNITGVNEEEYCVQEETRYLEAHSLGDDQLRLNILIAEQEAKIRELESRLENLESGQSRSIL